MELKSRNKSSKLIIICLIVSLLFISLGYSYIKTTLSIGGNVRVDNEFVIKKYVNILGKEMVAYPDNIASPFVSDDAGISIGGTSSNTNGKGLYLRTVTENNTYPIYYFRGGDAVDGIEPTLNNNVLFANMCWKIVRTTETGGVKLLYNGVPNASNAQGKCANTGNASQIGTSKFNESSNSLVYVGYMYNSTGANYSTSWYMNSPTDSYIFGTGVTYSNGMYTLTNTKTLSVLTDDISSYHYSCLSSSSSTCSSVRYVYYVDKDKLITTTAGTQVPTVYLTKLENGATIDTAKNAAFPNDASRNQVNSTIKVYLDNWFASNLADYVSQIEDTVFCNDRRVYSWGGMADGANPIKNEVKFTYGYYGYSSNMTCVNKYDRFTLKSGKENYNSSLDGNQMLDYPIGLLDKSEMIYSGYGTNAYTFSGNYYWSITPSAIVNGYASISDFNKNGETNWRYNVSASIDVRPSISLKVGTVASSGTGTLEDPFVVS